MALARHPLAFALRVLALAPRLLIVLALAAVALALLAPSTALARHSDILLAALVLATALGIPLSELLQLRAQTRAVATLSIAPLVALTAIAWVVGRPFGPAVRDGLLGVGASSSEVASVGLVALAGADATIALGALTGSLLCSVLLGPPLLALLGSRIAPGGASGRAAHRGLGAAAAVGPGGTGALVGRFALVVLVPLAVGVIVRSLPASATRLRARDGERDGLSALLVAALVYAALSGEQQAHGLLSAALASALLLACSAALALIWRARGPGGAAIPGAFAIAMRDFAVAAVLATQSFGPRAAVLPGVYGVLMLIAGSVAASRLRYKSSGVRSQAAEDRA